MTLVTVSGNAWTHAGSPIPSDRLPELWFRPARHSLSGPSLLTAVDVRATLSPTGAFTVWLEAAPNLVYRPWMRWLTNPGEQDPERWAWGFAEWPFEINPYPAGGDLAELAQTEISIYTVYIGLTDPPEGYRGWWLHVDVTDPDLGTGELRAVGE